MTGLPSNPEVREEFVAHILRLCRESARARSALRTATGRTPDRMGPEVHAAVTGKIPVDTSPAAEQAFYTIAALIAARPISEFRPDPAVYPVEDERAVDPAAAPPACGATATSPRAPSGYSSAPPTRDKASDPVDLGVSLAKATIANRGEKRPMPVGNAEKHLHLLSRQGLTGIHRHLPAVIRRLHELDQQIDWSRLLADLLTWEDEPRSVARRWLQSFYRALPRDTHPAIQEVER